MLLRKGAAPCHVGVALSARYFLHVDTGASAAIEALQGAAWRRRVAGFYQYARSEAR